MVNILPLTTRTPGFPRYDNQTFHHTFAKGFFLQAILPRIGPQQNSFSDGSHRIFLKSAQIQDLKHHDCKNRILSNFKVIKNLSYSKGMNTYYSFSSRGSFQADTESSSQVRTMTQSAMQSLIFSDVECYSHDHLGVIYTLDERSERKTRRPNSPNNFVFKFVSYEGKIMKQTFLFLLFCSNGSFSKSTLGELLMDFVGGCPSLNQTVENYSCMQTNR